MELNRDNMKKIAGLITFAILLYLGVQHLDPVLAFLGEVMGIFYPFIIGAAMAFVLNVPMRFIECKLFGKFHEEKENPEEKRGNLRVKEGKPENKNRKFRVKHVKGEEKKGKTGFQSGKPGKLLQKLARPVSLIISILFLVVIVMIVVLVVAPELANTFISVGKRIEENIPHLQTWLEDVLRKDSPIVAWANSIDFQPQKMLDSAINMLKNGANGFLSSTISVTMGIVNTAVNFGIGFIFACYILLQKEKLTVQVKKAMYALLPQKAVAYCLHVCSLAHDIFASFIAGQCIEAVILGSMFFVMMTILRFPYALLVGVLISFTALIPVFGGIIGCWVGFFLILMVNPMQAIGFLILFLVLQQIEGNFIYPHVVGNSVGLPSIWVLVAVTVGGSLMGIAGMLIFIPLVSVLYALFREWVYGRLEKKKVNVRFE